MPTSTDYRIYFLRARLRWLRGQTVTSGQVRAIYRRAADDTAQRIIDLLPSQPSARHLGPLLDELDALAYSLSDDVLAATLHGIDLSVDAAVTAARLVAAQQLGRYYGVAGINALYHSVNTRAVIALATRTAGVDGLNLSDRVWRIGKAWRTEVVRSVESAVARGLDPRQLAKEVQQHLRPGTVSPHKPAVRRRLGLSRQVDWRAMRLARTEMGNAFREGTVLGHSAHPAYLGIIWELSLEHPFEDECDDLAAGEDGAGFWSKGNEPLSPHPACLCVESPVMENDDAFDRRMQEWLDDPGSQPTIEEWHQTTARPFFESRPFTAPDRGIVKPQPQRVPEPVNKQQVFEQLRAELRSLAGKG